VDEPADFPIPSSSAPDPFGLRIAPNCALTADDGELRMRRHWISAWFSALAPSGFARCVAPPNFIGRSLRNIYLRRYAQIAVSEPRRGVHARHCFTLDLTAHVERSMALRA
jgi:hypothetical protein